MASSLTREEILKAIVYRVEKTVELMREESRKQNKRVSQVVQVLDMDGFGRKHMWIPGNHHAKARVICRQTSDEAFAIHDGVLALMYAGAELISDMLSTIDGNYPEMLFKTYIINGK